MLAIFYYYGIVFIYRCLRGIYYSERNSQDTYKMLNTLNPISFTDIESSQKNLKYISSEMKSKKYKTIFSILDTSWIVTGICLSVNWFLFVVLLINMLLSSYGVFAIKTQKKIKLHYILLNFIDVLATIYILYSHFFIITN